MTIERNLAGLFCREVADLLEPYVAGRLDEAAKSQVDEHVAGCNHCASFGDRYAALIARVREAGKPAGDEDGALEERLLSRLRALDP